MLEDLIEVYEGRYGKISEIVSGGAKGVDRRKVCNAEEDTNKKIYSRLGRVGGL